MNNQEQHKDKEENNNLENQVAEDELSENTTNIEQHNKAIEELKDQLTQLKDKLVRQLAETENLRLRSAKLMDEARDYAIFNFCKDIINVMDNLNRTIEHFPPEAKSEIKNILEGVVMTQNELLSIFKKHSLELISPQQGDKFDYNLHHAISQTISEDYEPGTIVNTMQVGYKIKDRLIRPAAVTVSKRG